PVQGLLVDLERKLPDRSEGASMSFADLQEDSKFFPRDRIPWTHPGTIVDECKKSIEKSIENFHERKHLSYSGTARFEGRSGMKVDYRFDFSTVVVTWDQGSRPYVAGKYLDFFNEHMFHSLELMCVFPRPSGKELTLTVMGEQVKHIVPR